MKWLPLILMPLLASCVPADTVPRAEVPDPEVVRAAEELIAICIEGESRDGPMRDDTEAVKKELAAKIASLPDGVRVQAAKRVVLDHTVRFRTVRAWLLYQLHALGKLDEELGRGLAAQVNDATLDDWDRGGAFWLLLRSPLFDLCRDEVDHLVSVYMFRGPISLTRWAVRNAARLGEERHKDLLRIAKGNPSSGSVTLALEGLADANMHEALPLLEEYAEKIPGEPDRPQDIRGSEVVRSLARLGGKKYAPRIAGILAATKGAKTRRACAYYLASFDRDTPEWLEESYHFPFWQKGPEDKQASVIEYWLARYRQSKNADQEPTE